MKSAEVKLAGLSLPGSFSSFPDYSYYVHNFPVIWYHHLELGSLVMASHVPFPHTILFPFFRFLRTMEGFLEKLHCVVKLHKLMVSDR